MLIKVESVQVTVPKLQEVVIKTFLRYANVLCCLFKCDALLSIHPTPLAHFNHDFADDTFFLPARAQVLTGGCPALDEGVRIFG